MMEEEANGEGTQRKKTDRNLYLAADLAVQLYFYWMICWTKSRTINT